MNSRINSLFQYTVPVLVMLLLMTGIYFSVGYLAVAAFIISAAWLCFASEINIIFCMFCLVSFANIFKFSSGYTSFFTVLELMMVFILVIRNRYINVKAVSAIAVLLVYIVISDLINSHVVIIEYLRQFISFFVLYCFIMEYNNADDHNGLASMCIKGFVLGLLMSSVFALFGDSVSALDSYTSQIGIGVDSYMTYRFSGLNSDPNYYSINVITALIGLIFLYCRKQIGNIFWVIFAALSALGLLTYSKSFILMYIITIIIFIVVMARSHNTRALVLSVIMLIAAAAFYIYRNPVSLMIIINRLHSAGSLSVLTTGRTELWIEYMQFLWARPAYFIFGTGIGAGLLTLSAHNWYIEALYYFGMIGSILYFAAYIICFRMGKVRSLKRSIANYAGILSLLLMYFFLHMVMSNELPFHLFIAFLIWNMRLNTMKEDELLQK